MFQGRAHLFKRAVGAIPQKRQEVWSVVLCIQTDLSLMVLLAFVVIPLEQFMEVLGCGKSDETFTF